MAFDAFGGERFQIKKNVEETGLIDKEVLKGRRQGERGAELGNIGEERKYGRLKPLSMVRKGE